MKRLSQPGFSVLLMLFSACQPAEGGSLSRSVPTLSFRDFRAGFDPMLGNQPVGVTGLEGAGLLEPLQAGLSLVRVEDAARVTTTVEWQVGEQGYDSRILPNESGLNLDVLARVRPTGPLDEGWYILIWDLAPTARVIRANRGEFAIEASRSPRLGDVLYARFFVGSVDRWHSTQITQQQPDGPSVVTLRFTGDADNASRSDVEMVMRVAEQVVTCERDARPGPDGVIRLLGGRPGEVQFNCPHIVPGATLSVSLPRALGADGRTAPPMAGIFSPATVRYGTTLEAPSFDEFEIQPWARLGFAEGGLE